MIRNTISTAQGNYPHIKQNTVVVVIVIVALLLLSLLYVGGMLLVNTRNTINTILSVRGYKIGWEIRGYKIAFSYMLQSRSLCNYGRSSKFDA